MSFAGTPLAVIAVACSIAAGLITLLYLVARRRRRLVVPSLLLWTRLTSERASSARWRQLRRLASWLLQLALLALLALSLADPRLGARGGARTIVLLIDASASMQASDESPSRLQRARAEARRLVSQLGDGDLATVLRLDAAPALLGPLTSDEVALEQQIDRLRGSDAPADLDRALRLAADVLAGRPRPTLLLIGDGAGWQAALSRLAGDGAPAAAAPLPLDGLDLRQLRIGRSGDNLAITAFSARRPPRDPRGYEVMIELRSFRDRATMVRLELRQEGELVDAQRIELAAGARFSRIYRDLAGAGAHLEARLRPEPDVPGAVDGGLDQLAVDDRAYALIPARPRQRVLLVSSGNLFLEGALLLDENATVDRIAPAAWDAALAEGYDALVLDAFTPPQPPARPALYIDPRGAASPFPITGMLPSPYVTDVAAHPVTRWVTLADINIASASVFALGDGVIPLAWSARRPIIVARDGSPRAVAIGFDVRRSDLPLRVAFPVLLVNALDWFAGEERRPLASYRTGVPIRLDARGEEIRITPPAGDPLRIAVHDGRATLLPLQAGFYRSPGGEIAASLLDAEESAIAPLTLSARGQPLRAPDPAAEGARAAAWTWLLVAALLASLIEWWTWNRGLTE